MSEFLAETYASRETANAFAAQVSERCTEAHWTPLVQDVVLQDGTGLMLRTPTSEDYADIKSFYDELSQESLYSRFKGFVRTDLPARLDAEADGDDRVTLAAWGPDRVVALGSYERLREPG